MSSVNVNLSHDKFRILVHGGAWDIPGRLMEAHRAGVRKAWQVAAHALESGAAPLEAVARTLACMEDDPVFDAGRGSFLNEDGEVELDASVMRGSDLQAGCVAAIRNFPNPSRIALALLLEGQNVLLAGSGAERFARSKGFSPVPACDLVHPREAEAHKAWIKAGKPDSKVYFSKPPCEAGAAPERRGTVGCVLGVPVRQGGYALYAGTSTGGVPGKRKGRVGDVPIVGAGIIADDEGAAVSATGWGEGLLRISAAMLVNERVKLGTPVQEAVEAAVRVLHTRLGGFGGLIAVDKAGRMGAAYSTPDMAFAGHYVRRMSFSSAAPA
ncbi:MAG TPA: peptidase T [Elusimicrobia bacterium]|nr:MAG: hypothetical protein A2089_11885 [Elusimicrobia bacterium GWD2_63_28]HCC48497.1 peptidase T [Elusimicrobiota bacterium]